MKLVKLNKDNRIKVADETLIYIDPDYLYIPVVNPNFKVNDYVFKDTLLTDNIYAGISGYIKEINKNYLVIANDFKEKSINVKKEKRTITIETILKRLAMYNSELYNLFKSLKNADNIVISGINDEPYVYNNIYILKDNIKEILSFLDELHELYQSNNTSLIIKNNDSKIIEECLKELGTYPNIKLTLVDDLYLLGKKEYLLNYLHIPINNTLYLTVEELVTLRNLVKYGLIDNMQYLTISGDALNEGIVLKVKKYTKLKDILVKYGDITYKDYVLVTGNLLVGHPVSPSLVITDKIKAIHVMKKRCEKEDLCINCGKCLSICPLKINILKEKKISNACYSCGLCSYVCPSHINLLAKVSDKS